MNDRAIGICMKPLNPEDEGNRVLLAIELHEKLHVLFSEFSLILDIRVQFLCPAETCPFVNYSLALN